MVMSINSDILYPPHQQVELCREMRAGGTRVGFYEIDSVDGHDGFLIESTQIAPILAAFLDGADDTLR